jgi:HlyD family secretion protein
MHGVLKPVQTLYFYQLKSKSRGMKMKFWQSIIVGSLLITTLAGLAACKPLSANQEPAQQMQVTPGDLTIKVNGNGKIGVANDAKLSFNVGGKVAQLNVKKGDSVKIGTVLARLETDTLEMAKSQAQVALAQARVAETQASVSQQAAEFSLNKTRDNKSVLELALLNAQVNQKIAEVALSRTEKKSPAPDIEAANAEVNRSKTYLQYAIDSRATARDTDVWDRVVERAQTDLDLAQEALDRIVTGADPDDIAIKKLQLETAEKSAIQAQKNLDDQENNITLQEAQLSSAVEVAVQAKRSVELAQLSLNQAQKQLKEAAIVAPFDGVVVSVDAKEGDIMAGPTVGSKPVIYLIDPLSMEVNAEIDEIDIAKVGLNQNAVISLDAAPGVECVGKVSNISMVPTQKQTGVVAYEVKVSIDTLPEIQLRVGMSATVDIVIQDHKNVVLVPNRAIQFDNQKHAFVEVTVNEQIQRLPVKLGLTDGVNTEVLSGLESGTKIVATLAAKKSATVLQ